MIRRRYACPSCEKQFVYDHHPSIAADPLPRFCPHCGFDSTGEFETALAMPAIGTGAVKRAEGVQEAVQEGANFRADLAREKFGLDADAARMLRDTSTAPVNNAVTQAMAQMPANTVGFNPTNATAYAASVSTGPYPNAGARAMQGVRQFHQDFTRNAGHNATATTTSEIPALETQQPGYRRRA
jgi:DNA-directed RNA polymerase subunit RPC12/RpoP